MGKSEQKRKSTTGEPKLAAKSRAARRSANQARKIVKQDVVCRMIKTSQESKTRGDIYGNVKRIIDDAIAVSPWMTADSLKCAARRQKQKKRNNELIVLRKAARCHQKRLQIYRDLIANKMKQDRSKYTARDWINYFIVRRRKGDPIIPRGKTRDVKPKNHRIGQEDRSKKCHVCS